MFHRYSVKSTMTHILRWPKRSYSYEHSNFIGNLLVLQCFDWFGLVSIYVQHECKFRFFRNSKNSIEKFKYFCMQKNFIENLKFSYFFHIIVNKYVYQLHNHVFMQWKFIHLSMVCSAFSCTKFLFLVEISMEKFADSIACDFSSFAGILSLLQFW